METMQDQITRRLKFWMRTIGSFHLFLFVGTAAEMNLFVFLNR